MMLTVLTNLLQMDWSWYSRCKFLFGFSHDKCRKNNN